MTRRWDEIRPGSTFFVHAETFVASPEKVYFGVYERSNATNLRRGVVVGYLKPRRGIFGIGRRRSVEEAARLADAHCVWLRRELAAYEQAEREADEQERAANALVTEPESRRC